MRNNKNPHNKGRAKVRIKRRPKGQSRQLSARERQAKAKGLAAISRVRRGESKSLSVAAKAEGTTVKTIKKLLPAALIKGRPGRPIRVKAGDSYAAKVRVLTKSGLVPAMARGSRERELAGRHRVTVLRVLGNEEPPSALNEFRGKTIGGQELIADFDLLSELAQADALDQLGPLYVSPGASQ